MVKGWPTLGLGLLVVPLADQLTILHQVELVAGVQGAGAHGAQEALQMVDVVLRPTHHLRGRNAHITSGTLCTVTSVRPEHWQVRHGRRFFIKPIWPTKASNVHPLPTTLAFEKFTYLKKSSLQKSWPFRAKHLSFSWPWHSLHCRHLACHVLSSTLRMKRSRISSWQPPHFGIVAVGRRKNIQLIWYQCYDVGWSISAQALRVFRFSLPILFLKFYIFDFVSVKYFCLCTHTTESRQLLIELF